LEGIELAKELRWRKSLHLTRRIQLIAQWLGECIQRTLEINGHVLGEVFSEGRELISQLKDHHDDENSHCYACCRLVGECPCEDTPPIHELRVYNK